MQQPNSQQPNSQQPNSPKTRQTKVQSVTMDELTRLSTRLNKVTNFNFIGAILCMIAGVYYAHLGSELLPKVFMGMLMVTLALTLLSYRASSKVSYIIDVVKRKKSKR